MTRYDAVNYISHGIAKRSRRQRLNYAPLPRGEPRRRRNPQSGPRQRRGG